jgi:hypothetical protein
LCFAGVSLLPFASSPIPVFPIISLSTSSLLAASTLSFRSDNHYTSTSNSLSTPTSLSLSRCHIHFHSYPTSLTSTPHPFARQDSLSSLRSESFVRKALITDGPQLHSPRYRDSTSIRYFHATKEERRRHRCFPLQKHCHQEQGGEFSIRLWEIEEEVLTTSYPNPPLPT